MARRIVVTSGKGGVGKTTICASLGMKLADFGFRVVILDMDIGLNNLDVVMGVENEICYNIIDVINGNCRLKQALVQDKKYPCLYVLGSKHLYEDAFVTKEDIKNIVDKLAESFDYILLDCPAGVEDGFRRAVYSATEALVVVTPHISSIRDADKVLSILASFDLLGKYIVINRVRGDFMASSETLEIEEIVRFLKAKLVGILPENDDITKGCKTDETTSYELSRSISLLAENIHNGTKKIFDCSKKYRGFWGLIRRNIKRRV